MQSSCRIAGHVRSVPSKYLSSTLHFKKIENMHILLHYDFKCALLVNPHSTPFNR